MPKIEQAASTASRMSGRRSRLRPTTTLSEMNVVPLVDVMLVLLIIFMVAAPMMQQGFGVHLPQARRSTPMDVEPIVVSVPSSVRQDNRVKINNDWVGMDLLWERVRQSIAGRLSKDVTVATDGNVQMQDMMNVIDQLKRAGVDKVGFLTQQIGGRER